MRLVTLFLLILVVLAGPVAAEEIYYAGCGQLVDGGSCVFFVPFDPPEEFGLVLSQTGQFGVWDFVYIEGTYDTDSVVADCGATRTVYTMTNTVISACEQPPCCEGKRGNVDGDIGDAVDIGDLTYLIQFLFLAGPAPACFDEANVNADATIDVADLTDLIFCKLFPIEPCELPDCPQP